MPATAHAGSNGGGVVYTPQPTVAAIACVKDCASKNRIQGGSIAKLTGQNLASVTKVVFKGSGTRGAAKAAAVKSHSAGAVVVSVPIDAQTGPVQALASGGVQSPPSKPVKILPAPPVEAQVELTPAPGAPSLETATSEAKFFLGSQRGVLFSYRLTGSSPVDVDVNLVRLADGTVVQTWTQTQVAPNEVRSVRWTGVTNGQLQPEGRYAFRAVIHNGDATATSAAADDPNRDAFDFYGHFFPVRGTHNFGGASARFGASRSGHTHQGQDVLAACGTKLVAAEGGTVKYAAYQSAAGYYLVIHGVDGIDNAYMHLAQPSPFSEGDKVFTAQQIGVVGDTGDATACHLHFEIWTLPGWYEGGKPIDPLPSLQAWDAIS
ncbi:MAG TPA: peptidoglycan DD-metalloendopeptidase family protein [Thermoleophilaceae bacterium]|nr:peptidoglycan DD-metalloendopeptidase family protein [Thermoleophilaceae bacterium]